MRIVNAFTDRRIEVLKLALQLKPDQEKYWPPVEEAIRARAMARRQRLVNLVARATGEREFNPVERLGIARCLGDTSGQPEEARRCVAASLCEP